MKKNIGRDFLFSKELKKDLEEDQWHKYSDGSGYYDGEDGKGSLYSDGSGYFDGKAGRGSLYSDGSGHFEGKAGRGSKYSDGSGYFEGNDGSYFCKYSDGSGYLRDKNGHTTYFDADEDIEEDGDIENKLSYQVGKALGYGMIGFIRGAMEEANNVRTGNNKRDNVKYKKSFSEKLENLKDSLDEILIFGFIILVIILVIVGVVAFRKNS